MTGMARPLRIGICQTESALGDDRHDPRPENLDRAIELMRRARNEGAQLVLFGEMYLNGYRSDETLKYYPTVLAPPDRYVEDFIRVARELDIFLGMGICRQACLPQGGLFNSAMVVGPAGVIGWYDKVHLGTFPISNGRYAMEGAFWRPGKTYRVIETPLGRLGFQICRDMRFPEASRVLALKGAEIIVNLAAAVEEALESWDYFARARAAENLSWFVMASVVGTQKDIRLFGGSRIVNPYGEVIARAHDNQEDLIVQEIDLDEVRRARAMSHIFDTRMPTAYGAITEDIAPD